MLRTKKSFKYQALLVLSLTVLFVWENYAQGSEGWFIVSEIMYDPKGIDTGKSDWIELHNPTDLPIVFGKSMFGLIDETEDHDLLTGKLKNTCHTMSDASITIEPNEYIVIADNKNDFLNNYPGHAGKIIDSTLELLSSGDEIKISFDRCKTWTAELSYDDSWGAKGNGKTLELIDNASGYTQDNWQESFVDGGTPGAENSKKQEMPVDFPPPIPDEKESCLNVKLNEVFPFTENEFVEVVNDEEHACDISGWRIEDNSGHKKIFPADVVIESGAFSVLEGKLYLNDDEDTVYLFDKKENKIDEVQYSANSKQKDRSYSYSLSASGWMWTASKTPREENEIVDEESTPEPDTASVVEPVIAPEIDKKTYAKDISITELFPNPFKSEYEEYIELYNGNYSDIDLSGWTLRDASKSGKYVFPRDIIIKAREYLAVFKKDFKFALNNSGKESVTLFDSNNAEVSRIEYSGSKKGLSYSLNGERWRWTKFLTPARENIFNNEPFGKIKIDEDVFENVYANFYVSTGDADGDKVKVTWDFGDKHKSYLPKTRHKYEKEGEYVGSVKLSDGSEDVVKNFIVDVEEFPHPKVRIVSVNANPFGADTGVEAITIENKSKKKINLKGWSIATGWKKFVNHPINEDVVIKKNKTKEITRKVSSFTLNNTKSKIQLRYPDGKVAHEVKYKSANKTIADGEVYRKIEGGWEWVRVAESQKSIKSIKQIELNSKSSVISPSADEADNQSSGTEVNNVEEIVVPVDIERENKLVSLNNESVKIELLKSQPCVLGAETVREIDGIYFFTPQETKQEHYAIVFFKSIFSNLNSKLNMLLNFFFK